MASLVRVQGGIDHQLEVRGEGQILGDVEPVEEFAGVLAVEIVVGRVDPAKAKTRAGRRTPGPAASRRRR